ncbi:MAG: hypothetical protein U5L96_03190 [Owenweeksia sp.]|nr:hypothetical protein [Owenweeksia sp.]
MDPKRQPRRYLGLYNGQSSYPALASYNYLATFSNACGSFSDTVVVIVPNCSAPSNLAATAASSGGVTVSWDTSGTAGQSFELEYGPVGYSAW